jgi:hypothetical protein
MLLVATRAFEGQDIPALDVFLDIEGFNRRLIDPDLVLWAIDLDGWFVLGPISTVTVWGHS